MQKYEKYRDMGVNQDKFVEVHSKTCHSIDVELRGRLVV